jgi:predicted nucleic acid-binding protein
MMLCDTNVMIHALNGNAETIAALQAIGMDRIALSAVTVMELYQGMGNKTEIAKMKKQIKFFDVLAIDAEASKMAIDLVLQFKLSHQLNIT